MRYECLKRPLHGIVMLCLLCLLVLLPACVHKPVIDATSAKPQAAAAQAVSVAADVTMTLLPSHAVLRNVAVTQRIDAVYAPAESALQDKTPRSHSFIVQLEAAGDDMRMVGLTPLGVQMFALVQHGTTIDVDVPTYVSLPFDPRFMLADMQLALAPLSALAEQLSGATLQQAADGSTRSLIASDGGERMRIRYRGTFCRVGGELDIEHLERRYRIHITTLSCDVL